MAKSWQQNLIRSIRNSKKRDYADRYLQWCLDGQRGPEPAPRGLGAMAAQAVRLDVRLAVRLFHAGAQRIAE